MEFKYAICSIASLPACMPTFSPSSSSLTFYMKAPLKGVWMCVKRQLYRMYCELWFKDRLGRAVQLEAPSIYKFNASRLHLNSELHTPALGISCIAVIIASFCMESNRLLNEWEEVQQLQLNLSLLQFECDQRVPFNSTVFLRLSVKRTNVLSVTRSPVPKRTLKVNKYHMTTSVIKLYPVLTVNCVSCIRLKDNRINPFFWLDDNFKDERRSMRLLAAVRHLEFKDPPVPLNLHPMTSVSRVSSLVPIASHITYLFRYTIRSNNKCLSVRKVKQRLFLIDKWEFINKETQEKKKLLRGVGYTE